VHVLNLLEGWAYCLDLPQPIGIGPASQHALALSPDGRTLYVADRSSGKIVVADTNQLLVRAVADVPADPDVSGSTAVVGVGGDGSLFLSDGSELLVVEPKTLQVGRHLALPGIPTGLGMSVDGQRLFVSTEDRILAMDPVTGYEVGQISATGSPHIAHIGQMTSR
jgi:DNA-binding beta-propeller fold protein YncE